MKVKATRSFVDGKYGRHSRGDVFELPKDVDWLNAGLVEPVDQEIESASIEPPKKTVIKKTNTPRKPRKPRAKKKAAN